ncbi:KN motif and ankyrin repeat domains 2 L homeolog [Xenopus laevis]|uniref:KN motif and ankyrin repeat domain-containing protein 2 n=1 Tax=Xenopus laevis TaxID=8355 RepID=Q801M7_XENLA|nr:KN motif and ankyrin repeat domains 2 L homeolog [Xenopus laevis]AAH49177.1 Kiaa1518-prov protein [Xenopus laevis]
MAQVLHMDAAHFPGKPGPSLSAIKDPEVAYSVETPYGYRLDLDFLKYVDDIEKGHTIKRVPVHRRPRYGSLPRGPGYTGSWWTSTESLCSNASNDSRHSSYSYCGRSFYPAYESRGGAQAPHNFNPRVEKTLLDASKKLEAGQSRPLSLGCRSTSSLSTQSLSRLPSTSSQQMSSFTPLSSGMSTPVSPSPAQLQHVREQMAVALKRLRQLEEQVKMIPVLQVKISVLQEEKRQLSVQLKSQKYLGHPRGNTRGKDRGELYIEIPEEESKVEKEEGEDEVVGKVEPQKEEMKQEEAKRTKDVCKKEMVETSSAPGKKMCSVGVWVRETDFAPVPIRQLEADKQKMLVQALSAKIAVLEKQLGRALIEVQNANHKLEEAEKARRAEEVSKREKKEEVRADGVKVARVERGSEVVSSTKVGHGVQPQRARGLEWRGGTVKATEGEEERVYKSREVVEKPLLSPSGPLPTIHLVKKISITGHCTTEEPATQGNMGEVPSLGQTTTRSEFIVSTAERREGDIADTSKEQDKGQRNLQEEQQVNPLQYPRLNGEMDSASSEDSGTMENPSDSESTESEYHEASEAPAAAQAELNLLDVNISNIPKNTEKEQPAAPTATMSPLRPTPRVELSNVLISGCVALQKCLDEGMALPDIEKTAAHGAILQEWMKILRQKDVDPSVIRHHLTVFRAMSPRLLEVIINMADGKGNTAVHYAVSQSNFTVVRQLLDTGLCDVNRQNKAGFTPLMLTALAAFRSNEDIETVTQMLRLGDVNCRASQAGQTALMLAVSHGRLDVVRALLACGADVNIQDHDGSTALMCACEHGHADIVCLLLAVPACDVSLTDNDGSTALSIALEAGQNDVAMLLSAHNSKTSNQDKATDPKCQRVNPSDESQ